MNKELSKAYDFYKEADASRPDDPLYEMALNVLNDVVEAGTEVEKALGLRWHIHYLKGDVTLALEDLNAAITLNPNARENLYDRGALHHARKNYLLALDDFNEAVKLAHINRDDDLIDAIEHHMIEIFERLRST